MPPRRAGCFLRRWILQGFRSSGAFGRSVTVSAGHSRSRWTRRSLHQELGDVRVSLPRFGHKSDLVCIAVDPHMPIHPITKIGHVKPLEPRHKIVGGDQNDSLGTAATKRDIRVRILRQCFLLVGMGKQTNTLVGSLSHTLASLSRRPRSYHPVTSRARKTA